ncbi:MAG: tetratricopeptide repeat protein [Planctomycetota bacterium]|nr:tetratricopeptide repeat protein [Planctomycetota bacterium]
MRLHPGFWLLCMLAGGLSQAFAADEDPRDDPAWKPATEAKGEDAITRLKELAAKYPRNGWPWYEIGERLAEAQDYEGAHAAYATAGSLGFDAQTVRLRSAKMLAKLKRYADAEKQYREALQAEPGAVSAQFGLGSALYSQNKPADALPIFETLAKRDDDWGAYAKEYLASCLYDTGKYDRAIQLLGGLLEKNPKDLASRWLYAKSLYKARRYEDALTQCRLVAEGDPAHREAARYYEGASLEALGRTREAEKVYAELSKGTSDWSKEARASEKALAGPNYRAYLDYSGGYDTGIVQAGDDNVVTGGKDYFSQVYAMVEGRVLRRDRFQLWLGAEHYGIHYAELTANDYFQDAATATAVFPKVGPFAEIRARYAFMYAQLDYQPYERQQQADVSALYVKGADKIRFGFEYGDNSYMREADGLSGPSLRVYADYKRKLPLWEHELRLRANADLRNSHASASDRLTQRVRLMYTAGIVGKLSGQVEGTYRRDDFPDSKSLSAPRRTDHRLSGEVRFEYQIWKHAVIQWGYLYESQNSTRVEQEYGRHQIDAGFYISF